MHVEPFKGVNLGGWLIVERWMTPSVFKGTTAIDEYTLSQTSEGRMAIEAHRRSFIKESDFAWMQTHGINAVRLPVGFWLFETTDSLLPHISYVDWTMKMADKYNIQVIIDLHGLQGSQNVKDHSGRIGKSRWFAHKPYRLQSLKTLEEIAKRYKDHPKLWGIQIINEPRVGLAHFKLRRYYKNAFKLLDDILKPETKIIYSDGFTPRLLSGALRSDRVVMDVHLYHTIKFWAKYVSLERYYRYLTWQRGFLRRLSRKQPVIIGEWSGTVRQPFFNALPVEKHGDLIREHTHHQIESFHYTAGWFYWNYKTEKTGVWDFRSQVDAGIIEI